MDHIEMSKKNQLMEVFLDAMAVHNDFIAVAIETKGSTGTEVIINARYTLLYADTYMAELGKSIDQMSRQRLTDKQVYEYIDTLFPLIDNATDQQLKNLRRMKEEVKDRYFSAPDLQHVGKTAYRFVNAVSDFATHSKPLRERANFRENLFARTVDGNTMIDKAYALVTAA